MSSFVTHSGNKARRTILQPWKKPSVILLSLALGLAAVQFLSFGGVNASAGKALKTVGPERAMLRDETAVHATGKGGPWINLANGRDLLTGYSGPAEVALAMESEQMAPLALASGDFDGDGMPDLVGAYSTARGGVLTIHRGNIDSVYPDTPEARARRADGTFTDAPFLSPGRVFELNVAPEFLEVGDFNADGHFDIAAAARSGSLIHLMRGDGRGEILDAGTIALPGNVTALASGDVNRADGISDLVAAVEGPGGAQLMVFEGPEGAMKSNPEVFDLTSSVNAIAIGHLGRDFATDIAVGAGRDLVILHGRDRKLSLNDAARAEVAAAAISRRTFESDLSSLAIGDFTGDTELELAVLTGDGSLLLVEEREAVSELQGSADQQSSWNIKTVSTGSARGKLLRARVSSLSHENIVMIDRAGRGLHIWMDEDERRERGDKAIAAVIKGRSEPATLQVEGEPVAVLPMRLNMDGLSDLVILRSGASSPTLALTQPNSTITVCNTSDCGSIGCGSIRAAIAQANQSPGMDMISFDGSFGGVPTITLPIGASSYPTITEAITLSGTSVGSCSSAAVEVSPQAAQAIRLNGQDNGRIAFRINAGGSVVRGFVVLNYNNGIQLAQSRGNIIEGNLIGIDTNGNPFSGNIVGLQMSSGGHTVGGTAGPARNVISGNNQNGIIMESASATDINVQNNIIGANAGLTALAGNGQNGVVIRNGANRNNVGGSFVGTANAIFGSGIDGVQISIAGGNNIQRNDIGQNQRNGVSVLSGSGNLIGGTNDIVRNNIFQSNNSGVEINGAGADSNRIQGNFIGVLFTTGGAAVDRGNNVHGIVFNGNASNNNVGGVTDGSRNIISFNRGDGVSVITGIRNLILSNQFFANQGLAIDLGNDGPTANDPRDEDNGPNTLLNFPELASASIISPPESNGIRPMETLATIRVTGIIRGAPNFQYFLQFYSTTACTGSSAQNDQQFLNTLPRLVLTDGQGNGPFDFTLPDVNVTGGFVNAIATDGANNTSEFSLCIPVAIGDCAVTCNATVPAAALTGNAVSFASTATPDGCTSAPVFDWDFGDNSAHSSEQNPSHTYAQPGTYNWRLTVTVTGGAPCIREGTIIVSAGPVIANVVKMKKKLIVTGAGFVQGAELRINGVPHKQKKVIFDSPTQITGKKAGKKIVAGDRVTIVNPNGDTSNEFVFVP